MSVVVLLLLSGAFGGMPLRLAAASPLAIQAGVTGGPATVALNLATGQASRGTIYRNVTVTAAVHHDLSRPLRDLPPLHPVHLQITPRPVRPPVAAHNAVHIGAAIPHPNSLVTGLMPAPLADFDGMGLGFTGPQGTLTGPYLAYPPDPNSAVGLTEVVQFDNDGLAVFSKTGTVLYGPVSFSTPWQGFGGACEFEDGGDAIVKYDHLANRWVLSQLANTNTSESAGDVCVAVSQTSDPTGAYYRYAFQYTGLADYQKLAVWPDAYYVGFDMIESTSFAPTFCAYDRAAMLTGAAATQQCFSDPDWSNGVPLSAPAGEAPEPADLDGAHLPPAGSPEYYLEADAIDSPEKGLILWKVHVDWTTPSNSTLTGPTLLSDPYNDACAGSSQGCIPQPGTTQVLDPLNYWAMYRLAYRNFGDHESLVTNVTVDPGNGTTGVDWFEIRNPNGAPYVYQQGTYAPDNNYRWMGSISMDQAGDIALGFSLSSSTVYPSLHDAGRLASDPLGQMSQGEGTIIDGGAAQVPDPTNDPSGQLTYRWGDYSSMAIDPADDCTFWYTGEYIPAGAPTNTASAPNYHTRIAAFKFPNCGVSTSTPTPSATATQTPTNTPSSTSTNSPTTTPTNTPLPTNTPTGTPTNTATNTLTDTPTHTPLPTNTATVTPSSTPTDTNTPSATTTPTPSVTTTPSPTATPSNTDTATQTATDTPSSTATPTQTASNTPSATPDPSNTPTATASDTPTTTNSPTTSPTNAPTNTPTATGTSTPTATLTNTPTTRPTTTPTTTNSPTTSPTNTPTATATKTPTSSPTVTRTATPTSTTSKPTATATATAIATTTTSNVTGQAQLVIQGQSSITSTVTLTVALYNAGPTTLSNLSIVFGPIFQFGGKPVTVLNSDLPVLPSSAGGFVYTSTQTMPLRAGQQSAPRGWKFSDPSHVSFSVPVSIYGSVLSGHAVLAGGSSGSLVGQTLRLNVGRACGPLAAACLFGTVVRQGASRQDTRS